MRALGMFDGRRIRVARDAEWLSDTQLDYDALMISDFWRLHDAKVLSFPVYSRALGLSFLFVALFSGDQ